MAASLTCAFCHRKPDEVPHLIVADRGSAIYLACARRCVDIYAADDAAAVARFPRPEIPIPTRVAPNTQHLDGFLHYARGGIRTGTPDPVLPWLREVLDVYETAVLDAVRETATGRDSLFRSNRVSAAFDRMMLPYRGDRRRAYLGAVFDRLLGRSIREGFAYHVDMTVLIPMAGDAA